MEQQIRKVVFFSLKPVCTVRILLLYQPAPPKIVLIKKAFLKRKMPLRKSPSTFYDARTKEEISMRFGGLIFEEWNTPEEWAAAAKRAGYSGVYFPVDYSAPLSLIDGYKSAADAADLVVCEIGVWKNTLAPDTAERESAIDYAVHQLELADYIGANCCVNIAGSYSHVWDGPHPDNFTRRAFDDIVKTTQKIIEAVNPKKTCYALEPMPWTTAPTWNASTSLTTTSV